MHFYLQFAALNMAAFILLSLNFRVMFSKVIQNRALFWLGMFLFTQGYWIVRRVFAGLDQEIPGILFFAVSAMLGLFLISLFTIVFADILLFISKVVPPLNFIYVFLRTHFLQVGLVVVALTVLQFSVGFYLATVSRTNFYTFENAAAGSGDHVRIVQISDLHVTTFTNAGRLEKVVQKINGLDADVVVFVGDIIDSTIKPYLDKDLGSVLGKIESRYGVYTVLGNHEYYGGDVEEAIVAFKNSNMTVLRDEAVDIDALGLTIAGRDDYISERFTDVPRFALSKILRDHDKGYPVIVLNHEPKDAEESIGNSIFLELSGHTHNGQLFPVNFLMGFMYPTGWGLWTKGAYSMIVSCGFGTWGPPVRTSSYSEIVVIDINK